MSTRCTAPCTACGVNFASSYFSAYLRATSADSLDSHDVCWCVYPLRGDPARLLSSRSACFTGNDHLNQFSHGSSCSSNGISSSTQGLHADGRPASLASSLWMWAMIIPFTRCQTLSQRFMHSKSGDKSTGSTVSYLGKRCPFTQESNRSKALSLKIQSREDSSPE